MPLQFAPDPLQCQAGHGLPSYSRHLRAVRRVVLPLLVAALLATTAAASENFDIQKLADGVFAAIPKQGRPVGSNAAIVVLGEGVMIVDTHLRPSYARELLEETKKLTNLPVRYVVNTHWHNDHTQGNQAYFNAFPKGVEFLSHTNTRRDIIAKAIPSVRQQLDTMPKQIEDLEKKLAGAAEADRARMSTQLENIRAYLAELRQIEITLPTITFETALGLYRDNRQAVLLYRGRGHTAGDVVVLLPKERIVITGDLLTNGIPFYRDAYPSDWANTLKEVARLEFDRVIPGHGGVQEGKQQITRLIAFMEALVAQVKKLAAAGKTVEQVKAEIDLSSFKADFPNFEQGSAMAIERAYLEATGKIRE